MLSPCTVPVTVAGHREEVRSTLGSTELISGRTVGQAAEPATVMEIRAATLRGNCIEKKPPRPALDEIATDGGDTMRDMRADPHGPALSSWRDQRGAGVERPAIRAQQLPPFKRRCR